MPPTDRAERRRRLVEMTPMLVRGALDEAGYGPDACISSTKVSIDALRSVGIAARPVSVRVVVFNKKLADWVNEHGGEVKPGELVEAQRADPEKWSLGIGAGEEEPGRWAGHLVALTRHPDLIIDPTLGQAARPQKDIDLRPFAFPLETPVEWLRGKPAPFINDNGVFLAYHARREDQSYRRSKDWWHPRSRPIVDRVALALRNVDRALRRGEEPEEADTLQSGA